MKRAVPVFVVITVTAVALLAFAYVLSDESPVDQIEVRGVLLFLDIETGCWVIRTADRKQYQPLGIILDRKTDHGKPITARGRVRNDLATTCMSGIPFEVTSYEKR